MSDCTVYLRFPECDATLVASRSLKIYLKSELDDDPSGAAALVDTSLANTDTRYEFTAGTTGRIYEVHLQDIGSHGVNSAVAVMTFCADPDVWSKPRCPLPIDVMGIDEESSSSSSMDSSSSVSSSSTSTSSASSLSSSPATSSSSSSTSQW